tara:strand:- start:405 stop:2009 length:1605 start_codon:yes stop_codon:yes gene_type:complete
MRGTDFDRYGKYLDYFVKSDIQKVGLESGVGYFYFISKFFELLSKPILISSIYVEPIYSLSIQLGNFLLLIIGLIGIYYLFEYLKVDKTLNLICLSFLSVFPPILGARLILKPEILAVAFLPWLILFYYKFFETNKLVFLVFSSPLILSLSVLKSSITFMIGLCLLTLFGKQLFTKKFVTFNIFLIPLLIFLINENFYVNGNYLWEHVINENYLNTASLSYIFSFSFSEIYNNPFRNNLSDSMLSIIFADTFNDYWQRYWYHKDGWSGKNFPGNLLHMRISILLSISFYFLTTYFLIKEKDKKMRNIGILGYVGILALIINALNLLPIFTQNFNPSKGDPMKTHLFSFLIIFSFYYFLTKVKVLKNLNMYLIIFIFFNAYIFTIISPVEVNKYKETFYLNKLHVASPCMLNNYVNNYINFSDNWCAEDEVAKSICKGSYDESFFPSEKDGYLIYENDPLFEDRNLTNGVNTVTVGNFYECVNYVGGGFYILSSNIFLNSHINEQSLFLNKIILLLGFFSIAIYFAVNNFKKEFV